MLNFTFLGTSSGVPTRERNVTGLAVQAAQAGGGASWFLIDAGEGTQQQLQRTKLSLHELAAVCITHVHGDHCYGLPGLLASIGMAGRTKPLTLIGPRAALEWFRVTCELTDLHLPYPVVPVDVAEQARVWDSSGVRIDAHPLRHRVPCHAYSVQVEQRRTTLDAAGLRTLGLAPGPMWKALQSGQDVTWRDTVLRSADWVSHETRRVRAVFGGDNAEPAVLREACVDAQVLVHEATYTQAVLDKVGPEPMHSAAAGVAEFAHSAGLPNLVLTHFSPRYHSDQGMADLQAEASARYDGRLWLAKDLDRFELDVTGVLKKVSE